MTFQIGDRVEVPLPASIVAQTPRTVSGTVAFTAPLRVGVTLDGHDSTWLYHPDTVKLIRRAIPLSPICPR